MSPIETTITAQNVDAPQLDSEGRPPPDYVPTPTGYFHRSCVYEVPNRATIDANNNVVDEHGTFIKHIPKCPHSPIRKRHDNVGHNASGSATSPSLPTLSGWVEWVEQDLASGQYNYMDGYTPVPSAPSSYSSGQLTYLFPGFEPTDGHIVYQTVLQYGVSPAGGGAYWGLAAWWVDTSNNAGHSSLVTVNEGDVIYHAIYVYDKVCIWNGFKNVCHPKWELYANDTTVSGKQVTLFQEPTSLTMTRAMPVALEAYGITACNQLPGSGYFEIYGASLYKAGSGGLTTYDPVTYGPSNNVPTSSPSCGYSATNGSGGSYLFWTP